LVVAVIIRCIKRLIGWGRRLPPTQIIPTRFEKSSDTSTEPEENEQNEDVRTNTGKKTTKCHFYPSEMKI
jgi:hypothetical protein